MSWVWNLVWGWLWGPSGRLNDCLSAFFSADELKGDNMYRYTIIYFIDNNSFYGFPILFFSSFLSLVVKNVRNCGTALSSVQSSSCQKF